MKYNICLSALFFFSAFFSDVAHSKKLKVPDPVQVETLSDETPTRPVELSKIEVKLSRGEPYGWLKYGLLCVSPESLVWRGGKVSLDPTDFNEVFKDELDQLGYDVVNSSSALFDEGEKKRAEYLVGGTIKSMQVDICYPKSGLGNAFSAKGTAIMEVEWQIYDRLNKKVVASHITKTGIRQKKSISGGLETIVFSAFGENVRALAASGQLEKFLVGEAQDLTIAKSANPKFLPIKITTDKKSLMTIEDAVGATVLIQSGSGHGSGFLISEEGYFLTNYHVVGQAKYVKLRWSDKKETLGEVIRLDRGRDIALIKSESRQRKPISLREGKAQIGYEVYAIGAPLDTDLQNTVTRGIVSATRVLDGYQYLQSDVSVVPGNSGGPLIDKEGQLIGVTVSGITINDAPQGVNFFIPSREAFEFLAIEETDS